MSDANVEQTADRIAAFLKDDAVVAGLQALEEQNYTLFLTAKTDDERRNAQAQAVVLRRFGAMLQGVMDSGELARTERERRERAPGAR